MKASSTDSRYMSRNFISRGFVQLLEDLWKGLFFQRLADNFSKIVQVAPALFLRDFGTTYNQTLYTTAPYPLQSFM